MKTSKILEKEEHIDNLSQECWDTKELLKKCLIGYALLHFTNLIVTEWLHLASGVFTFGLFIFVSLIFCFYGLTQNGNASKKT